MHPLANANLCRIDHPDAERMQTKQGDQRGIVLAKDNKIVLLGGTKDGLKMLPAFEYSK
jgi:hypothetical protein